MIRIVGLADAFRELVHGHKPAPIDWKARLAADVERRKALVGRPYAKRRAAALKARRG